MFLLLRAEGRDRQFEMSVLACMHVAAERRAAAEHSVEGEEEVARQTERRGQLRRAGCGVHDALPDHTG